MYHQHRLNHIHFHHFIMSTINNSTDTTSKIAIEMVEVNYHIIPTTYLTSLSPSPSHPKLHHSIHTNSGSK